MKHICTIEFNNDTTHLYYSGLTGGTLLIRILHEEIGKTSKTRQLSQSWANKQICLLQRANMREIAITSETSQNKAPQS